MILISAKDSVELEAYRNKLKGNILIFDDLMTYDHSNRPAILRRSDEDLKKLGEVTESEDTAACAEGELKETKHKMLCQEVC